MAALLFAATTLTAKLWPGDDVGGGACTTVYHAQSKGDDAVGELCVGLKATGSRVDRVTVALAAKRAACDDAVSLHVSASSPTAEVTDSRKVDCIGGRAESVFDVGADLGSGAAVCGSLPDDAPYHRFRPARTCVRL